MTKFTLNSISFVVICAILLIAPISAQQQNTKPTASPTDDVVRITSDLVQIDAVVTDRDGNQVTDLSVADFELYQDGKLQKITGFTRVNQAAQQFESSNSANKSKEKNAPLPPPARVNANDAGRILTFIVDDGNCRASQIGMVAAREALEKFVIEQMQPNDLVAIYRTKGGSSLLQQYTSDKTQLRRVARQIRWLPPSLGCGGSGSGEVFESARADTTLKPGGQQTFETDEDKKRREAGEDYNRDNQVVGTIGVLRYVVRGLERVGGRKTVFVLTDGLTLRTRANSVLRAQDALRDLTEAANRAAVVFNTIDVRGLLDPGAISASDDILPETEIDPAKPSGTSAVIAARTAEVSSSQNGMFYLANETGGRFYHDSNFLDVPIRRALDLEKGYYLLAYEPEESTFKAKKFHEITVKLKRADLNVRSRSGFIGVTDEETAPKKRTGDSELYEAIAAPLPNANLNLRLSAFFSNTATNGNFVRSLVHLDKDQIGFVEEANGDKKLVFDVVAVTMNEKNQVVDEFNRTHTIRVGAASFAQVKQNGLIYTADVPVKKAGTYTFRMAMRDQSNKQLGSASQVIEVPELKKNKLFLSDLIVSGVDANGKFAVPEAATAEAAFAPSLTAQSPAVRRFKRGDVLAYSYKIYNAQIDKATNQPKLTVQTMLYFDGKPVSDQQPAQPAQLEKQSDLTRIKDYGYLRLNQNVQFGDYALQIVIKDLTTNQTSSQWIDFEIVN